MKVITGKVVGGKVELPPGSLAEGESVAVVARDTSEPVVLSTAQEQELTQAFEAIARGDFVDGDELVQRLKARPGV
ncbi:MAG: hypothetical protein AB1505_23980 [Candidatus Latescibacterota bacterium]